MPRPRTWARRVAHAQPYGGVLVHQVGAVALTDGLAVLPVGGFLLFNLEKSFTPVRTWAVTLDFTGGNRVRVYGDLGRHGYCDARKPHKVTVRGYC